MESIELILNKLTGRIENIILKSVISSLSVRSSVNNVVIDAAIKIRFERWSKRNRESEHLGWPEFLKENNRDLGKGEPAFFSARKNGNLFEHILAGEQKSTQEGAKPGHTFKRG